jgi:hypothetical protein
MLQLMASIGINQLWHMVPLIVAISLVYGATRHENMGQILVNSVRAAWWIISFMGIICLILLLLDWQV